jgi:hypothetical protein
MKTIAHDETFASNDVEKESKISLLNFPCLGAFVLFQFLSSLLSFCNCEDLIAFAIEVL